MIKDKIDVIIPAYKAHGTIIRCLSSVACQTIIGDVSVTIVNDCCPEGDYSEAVRMFSPVMDVREIRMPENGGPGLARQYGIDNTEGEFITFIDADDALYKVTSLETLRTEIQTDKTYMCASGAFFKENHPEFGEPESICLNMVWVFGKIYRRDFLDKYEIRFNNTRANEDSGFNHIVSLLCDTPEEQVCHVEEYVYYYHKDNKDSITNINGGQYWYDQCVCGAIDNMIYAIEHARKYKPFSSEILRNTLGALLVFYTQYVRILEHAPDFSIQLWEYIKKYYHACYKRIEDYIAEDLFKRQYSMAMAQHVRTGDLLGVIPKISIKEFMRRLRTEEYDPNLINEIREEMESDPRYQEIMKNNIACGVCPDSYTDKKEVG